jgi:hypothetical protein
MEKKSEAKRITIRYTDTSALFSSQFLVNSTPEDITVGFSSGYMKDPGTDETSLPIHSRIAMTHAGAKRLHELLGKVLAGSIDIPDSKGIKGVSDDQKH